jgi:hypothetical protein
VGELGIRSQRADLEDESEGDVLEVNVPERLDLRTVAGQEWQRHIEEEEENDHDTDTDAHFPANEGSPVPPTLMPLRQARRR